MLCGITITKGGYVMAGKKGESITKKFAMNWKGFFVAASVTLNIAFVAVFVTIVATNALDRVVIREGLIRYCAASNDGKFEDSSDQVKALREFACASGDAQDDFEAAFNAYLTTKGIE
jgi:hypothetical protein